MDGPAVRRPIGWWLKEADSCIEAAFEAKLQDRGVDRRTWQVLASLANSPASRADVTAALSSFDSPAALDGVLADLQARGWVTEELGLLQLTPSGRSEHAELSVLVDQVRSTVAAALPDDDYDTLVSLLRRLVEAFRHDG